jgi:hypothetical protein
MIKPSRKSSVRLMRPSLSSLVGVLLGLIVGIVNSSDTSPRRPLRQPLGGKSIRSRDATRRIQSWMIKQRAIPKTRSLGQAKRRTEASTQGSMFTLQRPTKAIIYRWFGVDDDPGNLRCMLQRRFNHGRSTIYLHSSLANYCFETYLVV